MAVKWLWNGRRNGRGNCTKTKLKENQFKIGLCRFAYRIEGYYTIHFDKTFSTILKTITYFECCQTDWRLLCIIYMLVGMEHMTFESYGVLASIMLFMWTNNGNLFRIFTLHENNFREFKPKHVKFNSQTWNCFH